MGGEDRPALPRRREPDLSGLAMFTMDSAGRLTSWSPTAAGMFGHRADAVVGQHLSDVLLTGPGQDSLVERALAEVAEKAAPGSRVVYADIDPVAIAHSTALLAGKSNAIIVEGDVREPEKILADDRVNGLIDFSRPAGLLLVAVLHFITDAENPARIVATLRDALAPGSYLVLSHGTTEDRPTVARAAEKVYDQAVAAPLRMRSRAELLPLFEGFELLEPGLVPIPHWRPDPGDTDAADTSRFWGGLAGVAVKR